MYIEKNIHFIWIGDDISEKYILNIYSFLVRNKDYKIFIWTDRYNCINNTLCKMNISHNFNVKLVSELFTNLQHDFPQLFYNMIQESCGTYKNLAVESDILRIYILLKFGGIYIDTDTNACNLMLRQSRELNFKEKGFGNVYAKHGILYPCKLITNTNTLLGMMKYRSTGKKYELGGNNDVIFACKNLALLRDILENMQLKYQTMDKNIVWHEKRLFEHKKMAQISVLTEKIGKLYQYGDLNIVEKLENKICQIEKSRENGRLNQTLNLTGPNIISSTIENYFAKRGESLSTELINSISTYHTYNKQLLRACDGNWNKKIKLYASECFF